MDYNSGSALTCKCIFCYDFISIFFIETQYMTNEKINGLKTIITKNLPTNNYGFWMIRFGSYFQKSQSLSSFVGLIFFSPLTCMLKSFLNGQSFIWI